MPSSGLLETTKKTNIFTARLPENRDEGLLNYDSSLGFREKFWLSGR
jgi:hypothetical protein